MGFDFDSKVVQLQIYNRDDSKLMYSHMFSYEQANQLKQLHWSDVQKYEYGID